MEKSFQITPLLIGITIFTLWSSQSNKYYQVNAPWFTDISQAALDSSSTQIIDWLALKGGWGSGKMRIDFSIEVLESDNATSFKTFTKTDDFYEPDCDFVPMPVPAVGALEGETGYDCTNDGDCHLIVFHKPTRTLYEMWRADKVLTGFLGGCLAVWDLRIPYNPKGRGEQCTSADAAGLPIAPLLFTPDEVAAGDIDHAIRFILPNDRIRNKTYVRPGTHATGAASGGIVAPAYGARLRLKASFPVSSLPSKSAQVVAHAMQKYGIILADGGTIALTGTSDRFFSSKWDTLLNTYDLQAVKVTDFEVVDGSKRYLWTGDCERTTSVTNPYSNKKPPAALLQVLPGRKTGMIAIAAAKNLVGMTLGICTIQGKIVSSQKAVTGQQYIPAPGASGVYCAFLMSGKELVDKTVVFCVQ
jgi:serine/threonine-protein kinase